MAKVRANTDAQKRKRAIHESALRGLSILIVDDNPDARTILAAWFEHLGCVAVTAESAVASMYRLARPDIVLTDIYSRTTTGTGCCGRCALSMRSASADTRHRAERVSSLA